MNGREKQCVTGLKSQTAGRKPGGSESARRIQAPADPGLPLPGLAGHQAALWKAVLAGPPPGPALTPGRTRG